jgi:hypothetical protein
MGRNNISDDMSARELPPITTTITTNSVSAIECFDLRVAGVRPFDRRFCHPLLNQFDTDIFRTPLATP